MNRTLLHCAVLALAAGSFPAAGWPQPPTANARQWLERMIQATQTLNYEGTFVYVQGPHIEAMHIVHSGGNDHERQRLISLSGPLREVVVANNSVICLSPERQATVAGSDYPRSPFPVSIPSELGQLESHYEFTVLGEDRVAGLDTQMIAIRPKDTWRFGYRLWLDRRNGMVLRSALLDDKDHPVEQLMFTDFQLKPHIDEAEFKTPTAPLEVQLPPVPPSGENAKAATGEPVTQSEWRIGEIPEGFIKALHNRFAQTPSRRQTEHLVFADGLATISVFLEKLDGMPALLQGASQFGSMNAFGTTLNGYQILVVGEVPAATVQHIANSIQHTGEAVKP